MLDYKVAKLPEKGCLKSSHSSFPLKSDFFKLAKKSLDIWATLTIKWIAKNFDKSPNLVILLRNKVKPTRLAVVLPRNIFLTISAYLKYQMATLITPVQTFDGIYWERNIYFSRSIDGPGLVLFNHFRCIVVTNIHPLGTVLTFGKYFLVTYCGCLEFFVNASIECILMLFK